MRNPTFIAVAREGPHGWKHYLLGMLVSFGTVFAVSVPILFLWEALAGGSFKQDSINKLIYGNPYRTLAFHALLSVALTFGLYIAVTRIHQRKFLTLISPDASFDWRRVVKSFTIWTGLTIVSFSLWYWVYPSRYSLTFNASEWIPFALLAMPVVLLGALLRAFLFYGYWLQGLGLLIQRPILLSTVWGLILGTILLNPKVPIDWVLDVTFAIFVAWIVLKENRVEAVIGMSIPSLFVNTLLIGHPDTTFKYPKVFAVPDHAPFIGSLLTVSLMCTLFYYLYFRLSRNSISKAS